MDLLPADDAALAALFWPMQTGAVAPPAGAVLFLGARPGAWIAAGADWRCEQGFRPFADALRAHGIAARARIDDTGVAMALALPPRSREAARAMLARAVHATAPGGVVMAAAANDEGGRSVESDLRSLVSGTHALAKHKSRIAFATVDATTVDAARLTDWLALDAPRQVESGAGRFWSRPGLFAWNRIDPASALLAENLPETLRGAVADLGAGWGFLSLRIARRCPDVTSLDLFEAQAEALEPARRNLATACEGRDLPVAVHWHDVTAGLPGRYDAIVSNPPFHVARTDMPDLGRTFIQRAADALLPEGALWLVANRHLPYEATLSACFAEADVRADRDGYKVIRATGVRR